MQKYVIEYVIYTICLSLSSGRFLVVKCTGCITILGLYTVTFEEGEFPSSFCGTFRKWFSGF